MGNCGPSANATPFPSPWLRALLVAVIYFALGLAGLQFSLPGGIASAIWPAAGFALGALLVWGPHCAAGVYLGALAKDLWLGVPLGGALLSALGPLLQALAGYWLTRRLLAGPQPLQDRADILRFLLLAGPVACLVSASLTAAVLFQADRLPPHLLLDHWFTWWSGDVLGVALFAPLALFLLPGASSLRAVGRSSVALPLLLAAGVLAQLHVAYDFYEEDRAHHAQNRVIEQVVDNFIPNLHLKLAAPASVERFITASDAVTRREFAEFTTLLLSRPDVLAVEWLPRVRQAERAAFERSLAREELGRGGITEFDAGGALVPAGSRSEYFPAALLEPLADGRQILGLDRWPEASRQAAMARARDSGGMIATAPAPLRRYARNGIYVFMPAYRSGFEPARASEAARRDALRGFALVVFDQELLFESLAADAAKQGLLFRVTDLGLAGSAAVLAGTWPATRAAAARADWRRELEVAGRRWRLEVRATAPAWRDADGAAGKLLDTVLMLAALLVSFGVLSGNGRAATLAANERRFRNLTQNLNGMAYRCRNDPDWSMEFASRGCRELLGREPDDLLAGRPTYGSLIHPEDSTAVWDQVQLALAARQPWRIEYRVRHADGTWRWVWEQGAGIWDAQGRLSHLEGFVADISAHKHSELELVAAKKFLGATLDALSAHIAIIDGAGIIVATNRAWRDFAAANAGGDHPALGVGGNYVAVCEASAAAGDADAARLLRGLRAVAKGEEACWAFEYPCHTPTEPRWFYCRITRLAEELAGHLVVAHENITAIRSARVALDESELRQRSLLDAIPDTIWLKNSAGIYLDCNPAFERQLGAQKADIVGRGDCDLVTAELADTLREQDRQAMASGKPVRSEQWISFSGDGRRHRIETVKTPLPGPDGMLLGVLGIGRDITARHRVEAALNALNSPEIGTAFFESICRALAELSGAEVGFVGTLLDAGHVRTVALIVDGAALPSMDYALAGTPCEGIVGKSTCVHADSIQQLFPADTVLAELGAVAYAAAPLWDSQHRPLGLIGVIARRPITEPDEVATLLQLMALRVGAELERVRDIALLRASEEKYRRLVENVSREYFFYQHDRAGIITYVGPSIAGILGYTPEEFRVHFATYLTDHPDNAMVTAHTEASLRGEGQPPYLVEVLHKDGRRIRLEVAKSPLRDAAGAIVGAEGIAHDVTLRQATEQALRDMAAELERRVEDRTCALESANATLARSELETRSLVENLADCVISIDDHGIILSANRAVERTFGYGVAELVGHNVSMLMPQPHRAAHDGYLARYRSTGQARIIGIGGEVEGLHKDGSRIAMELSISEYRVDGKTYFTGVLRDIRERHRNLQELQRARQEAEQASQAKSAFLAAMSHEIRTPMNGVIGMVDVLHQTSLKGYQVEIVDTIRDSAYSLLGIIEDILDFSKIEAGRMEIEQEAMSVAPVVEQVCKMLDQLAARKDVELTLFVDPAIPAQVMGDALRLRQVLVNLANNAIKFSSDTARPGKVSLRALLSGRDAARATVDFVVTDNGIGMDEATQARLFSSFSQADVSTTRRFGGTGLGLAIAGNLVRMMGGTIGVHSAPEAGSRFVAQIPFTPLPDPPAAAPSPLAGLRCVVVGDSPGLADDFAAYLAHAGAATTRAPDLAQARPPEGPPALAVWVIDAGNETPRPGELERIAAACPAHDLRFVHIGRGQRRTPRADTPALIKIDGNLLDRQTFLDAVAMAAGRTVAEQTLATDFGEAPATVGRPSRDEARRQGRLILVAEDNETNQKVLLRQLGLLGYAAHVAGDGRKALELWACDDFGLLLTDLHMPYMDGYELTAAIRGAETGARRIPIIALTANALSGEAEHCRQIGMDDYLSKPVPLDKLKAVLLKWLPPLAEANADDLAVPELATADASAAGEIGATGGVRAAAPCMAAAPAPARRVLPAIDVSVLEELVGDDPPMIRSLLQTFRDGARAIAAELRMACEQRQAAEAGALGHKLKSSARAVGALALGELCADIERAGKNGDADAIASLLPRFEGELAAVTAALDARLSP